MQFHHRGKIIARIQWIKRPIWHYIEQDVPQSKEISAFSFLENCATRSKLAIFRFAKETVETRRNRIAAQWKMRILRNLKLKLIYNSSLISIQISRYLKKEKNILSLFLSVWCKCKRGKPWRTFFPRICGSKLLCPIAIPVKRERNRRVEVSRVSRDRIHPSWRMDFSTRRDVIASKAITVAPDRIAYCTPCSSLLL